MFHYEVASAEERLKSSKKLQKAWARTVQDVLKKLPHIFGGRPRLQLKETIYSDCRIGTEVDIPVTGTSPHMLHFAGKRGVTGHVIIRSGRSLTEIFILDKNSKCQALALAVEPTREAVKQQLLMLHQEMKAG